LFSIVKPPKNDSFCSKSNEKKADSFILYNIKEESLILIKILIILESE